MSGSEDAKVDKAERKVQLREEPLRPETERVRAGEVEIRTAVVGERRTIHVPLARDEVEVDFRPVKPAPADQPIGEEETIGVPVHKEALTGVKETVVTGELVVTTRQAQDTKQVSDTVRREEPKIEKEGDLRVERKL